MTLPDSGSQPDDLRIPAPAPVDASSDVKAESEAAAYAFNLDLVSAKTGRKLAALTRRDKLEGTIGKVLRLFIWTAASLAIVSFGILFFHLLAPTAYLFLESTRVVELREFLFSGTFGAGLAALWKSQARKDDENED